MDYEIYIHTQKFRVFYFETKSYPLGSLTGINLIPMYNFTNETRKQIHLLNTNTTLLIINLKK